MKTPATTELASHRAGVPHTSMFLRMLLRAAVLRRGRAASALLAMIVAAAVATAMLNLYVDVQTKLRKEFRNYGANIVVLGRDGQALPPESLQRVTQHCPDGDSRFRSPMSSPVLRMASQLWFPGPISAR